jgi:hypothetical protein
LCANAHKWRDAIVTNETKTTTSTATPWPSSPRGRCQAALCAEVEAEEGKVGVWSARHQQPVKRGVAASREADSDNGYEVYQCLGGAADNNGAQDGAAGVLRCFA